jgi:hypothetical protein
MFNYFSLFREIKVLYQHKNIKVYSPVWYCRGHSPFYSSYSSRTFLSLFPDQTSWLCKTWAGNNPYAKGFLSNYFLRSMLWNHPGIAVDELQCHQYICEKIREKTVSYPLLLSAATAAAFFLPPHILFNYKNKLKIIFH